MLHLNASLVSARLELQITRYDLTGNFPAELNVDDCITDEVDTDQPAGIKLYSRVCACMCVSTSE